MSTATCNGPNRLHFSTNGDGHETKKEDSSVKKGRDARGRFAAGNPGGPGNPFARQVAHLRKLVLETLTDEDLRQIVLTLILKAKEGDLGAAKLLLVYTLGKPAEAVDPDRLDIEEWQLAQEGGIPPVQMHELMATLPADKANELMDIVRPCVLEQQLIDPMLSGLATMDRQDAAREARRAKRAEQRAEAVKPNEPTTDNKPDKRQPASEESAGQLETTGPAAGDAETAADSKRSKPSETTGIEKSSPEPITDSNRAKRGDAAALEEASLEPTTDRKREKRADAVALAESSGESTTDSKRGKRVPEFDETPGGWE